MSPGRSPASRADVCTTACADAFSADGEVLVSPFGTVPALGARLAHHTTNPDLVLTDGVAAIMSGAPPLGTPASELVREAPMPYRSVFGLLWGGRRHVMMMATQVDRTGNQNISCIGDWSRPKAQLVGVRGAPGNTMHHATSYWVPAHSPRSFVAEVDMVCGVGTARAAAAGAGARFHDLRVVVSNLGVFDFCGPGRTMRVRSIHPGVNAHEVAEATGFPLAGLDEAPPTRLPTHEELELLRTLDPRNQRDKEVPG